MALEITGERTLPGIWHERYWHQRHVATYRFAAARCRRLEVVDAGCGEGYGAALLAGSAAVTGVELVGEVVEHARARYPHVRFVESDVCSMPLPDASADAVVCLQVIEHLWDIGRFLDEVARVLRPGGELYCSTPNRLTFTPGADQPTNPFHTVEFTAAELAATLSTRFRVTAMLGVHHGWRLRAVERALGGSLPQRLLDQAPHEWPRLLRSTVTRVRPDDFLFLTDGGRSGPRPCRLDDSLDLLAVATKPRGSP